MQDFLFIFYYSLTIDSWITNLISNSTKYMNSQKHKLIPFAIYTDRESNILQFVPITKKTTLGIINLLKIWISPVNDSVKTHKLALARLNPSAHEKPTKWPSDNINMHVVDHAHCSNFIYEFFPISSRIGQNLYCDIDFIVKLSFELTLP